MALASVSGSRLPLNTRLKTKWGMVAILWLAAALRLVGQRVSPPGLSHDEVANWLIDRQLLGGQHAIYFTQAYGHEAGFHYVQAAFVALLGDHALALRLPAAFAGILLVAVCFALARRWFGSPVALTGAALLAVLFWPVFFSRQGLRAITLPVVSGLSAICWWRGWQAAGRQKQKARFNFLLAGILAGLSLYTYQAARALPLFYLFFVAYLGLFHRQELARRWRHVALFFLLFALVAFPLARFLLATPGAEYRVGEIDAPLRALLAGEVRPILANSARVAGMFGLAGDPLWRQNVAGMPVFDPLAALFFYAGAGLLFWRWRDTRAAFALLWLLVGTLPSIATIDAPSFIRIGNSLLVVTIFPALIIHNSTRLSTVFPRLSTALGEKWGKWGPIGLTLLLLVWHIGRTGRAIFSLWPANSEVQFVWQQALTDAARFLDRSGEGGPVAVAGWTPDTMDPPTMALSLQREDLRLAFFEPERTLLVPATAPGQAVRLVRPAILPLDPMLEARLASWGAVPQDAGSFTWYEMNRPPGIAPAYPLELAFGQELEWLGYDPSWEQDGSLNLVTFWRVTARVEEPRRFFLHAVDDAGTILAQDDGLGVPPATWQVGDLILYHFRLPPVGQMPAGWRLGLYNPQTGQRLPLPDGRDFYFIGPADVPPPPEAVTGVWRGIDLIRLSDTFPGWFAACCVG